MALDVGCELLDGAERRLHRRREGRSPALAERLLEPQRRGAERIQVGAARDARLLLQRLGQSLGSGLGFLDPLRVIRLAQLGEPRLELGEMAAARGLSATSQRAASEAASRTSRPSVTGSASASSASQARASADSNAQR